MTLMTQKNNQQYSNFYYKGHDELVARMRDLFHECISHQRVVMTSFLSLPEQYIVESICPKEITITFNGGYNNAERKIACLSFRDDLYDSDIVILKTEYDPNRKELHHKDVLGALMHLGLEREVIGDICIEEDSIILFVKEVMADFIQLNCIQIGRIPVTFERVDFVDVQGTKREEILVNVSSLRMDAIVAALAHCSRKEAVLKIKQGFVKINDVILETNQQLCNNDFVSIRKVGRFQYIEIKNTTRKDRLVLRFEKYA